MLERGKPLAHFSDAYPPEPEEDIIPRDAFASHVANGTFEMCTFIKLLTSPPPSHAPHVRGTIHIFYARPNEAWRIDAYIAMMTAAAKAGWSEGFERLEGILLGYTESQIDAHIEHLLRAPHAKDFPWLRRLMAQRGG
jgi:hypothetical protein